MRVYDQAAAATERDASSKVLHVYLEGDGRPWATETRIASDPHTQRALAFSLMRLDPAPSIYLTRPCYHRQLRQDGCSAALWTSRRYGPEVLAGLAAALRAERSRHGQPDLVLIGHSGGGTLAVLLAEQLGDATRAVVTLGANLDVAAWAILHGYTPLVGSLDPARRSALPGHIRQLHVAGGLDANVPVRLIESYVEDHAGSEIMIYPNVSHTKGWIAVWPEILAQLAGVGSDSGLHGRQ